MNFKNIARYTVTVAAFIAGVFFEMAAIQSADFSVPASPVLAEIYKTRAMAFMPIGTLFFLLGGILFVVMRPPNR